MKRYVLFLFLLIGISSPMVVQASCSTNCASSCSSNDDCCGCPCAGKTFFTARPLYQSYRPELWSNFRNDKMMLAENGIGGAFDIVGFGAASTNGSDLAAYFLPNCKRVLTVREKTDATTTQDLLAEHFNIFTVEGVNPNTTSGFVSTLSFCASQHVMGLGLHYKQGFWFNDERTKWWYLDVSSSVQQVKNKMELNETVSNTGGGADTAELPQAVGSMTAAFNQSAWNYGKIVNCDLKKTGLADIELKIGYQWMWYEHCHYAGYLGVLIPTGNKPKAEFVFEPIVGHNKHFGILTGSEGGFEFWTSKCNSWHATFEFAAQGQYRFKNTQVRSFDLKNKPWSRYMEVYANQAQAQEAAALFAINPLQGAHLSTPGINVFTQCVHVTPGFSFNATSALLLAHDCGFAAELGYNFFARQAECVTLADCWQTGPALKDASGAGDTNPVRNITGNSLLELVPAVPVANYNQSLILASDLDLNSAAHPNIITHLFHGALSYNWNGMKHPVGINAGASYEFAQRDFAVMRRWTLWGKLGFAF